MLVELDSSSPQDLKLAEALAAVAHPTRLALLRQLRVPKALREIEVRGSGPSPQGHDQERTLARQTVRVHLDKCLEAGIVVAREAEREYGPTLEYHLNQQRLFAIAEEFRELARLRPAPELDADTVPRREAAPASAFDIEGPCLVLVKGLDEGRTFPVKPRGPGRQTWVVGRDRGADISLDFDPYVSTENTAVVWEGGRYLVHDLPDSMNGTTLNFRPLPKGVQRPIRAGDIVGAGRCLLLFRT